jgi:molecular chaperone DnaK (HSP70)
MLLDSFEHAEADFAARLLIEARNEAESVVAATEKVLRAPEFASVARTDLAPGEQPRIEAALARVKEVLGSSDREAIHDATRSLNEATQHLAEAMMNRSLQAALSGRSIEEL